jgi:hypothetical protein
MIRTRSGSTVEFGGELRYCLKLSDRLQLQQSTVEGRFSDFMMGSVVERTQSRSRRNRAGGSFSRSKRRAKPPQPRMTFAMKKALFPGLHI